MSLDKRFTTTVQTSKAKTFWGRFIEQTDFYGYNPIIQAFLVKYEAARKDFESVAIDRDQFTREIREGFANAVKRCFGAMRPGTMSYARIDFKRFPAAFAFMCRQHGVIPEHLPADIVNALHMMRNLQTTLDSSYEMRQGKREIREGSELAIFIDSVMRMSETDYEP